MRYFTSCRKVSKIVRFFAYGRLNPVIAIGVLTIATFAPCALAQEGVTCGMVETPSGPEFWGARPRQGPPPPPADTYSAIAVSSSTLKSGMAWSADSQSQAERLALDYCRKQGASDCKIQIWARNACVALATSDPDGGGAWGTAWDTNRARAKSRALASCHSVNGKECSLQQSACSQD